MKTISEPSSLLRGISHREMLDAMADAGIFCSVDKFRRVLDWAQRSALADQAKREAALTELVRLSEEMGAYDVPPADAKPGCPCETCRPLTMTDMRMVLYETCGNKRCPHATDHRNACTDSNEPGQKGSSFEHCAVFTE